VYERVRGETFGLLPGDPVASPAVWREVGTDLALLHRAADPASPLAGLACEELPDGGQLAEELAERGGFGTADARWLRHWLERLAGIAGEPPGTFVHGDVQTTNVMLVDGAYVALLAPPSGARSARRSMGQPIAMSTNRERWSWAATVIVSVGPLRCLATMKSASPARGDSLS
jgi:Phosphotransferase enzyme family